jgi:hypothetical protein
VKGYICIYGKMNSGVPWSGHFNFDALREQVLASSRKYLAELEFRLNSQGIKVYIAYGLA